MRIPPPGYRRIGNDSWRPPWGLRRLVAGTGRAPPWEATTTRSLGRVLYAGNFPIVPPDEFWIPARSNPVKLSIVPIGGIHIFIGETVDSDGNALVEAPGNGDAPDQQEAVGDSDAPEQDGAGNPEESILGNLSPTSGDSSSMDTEEFNRKLEELGGGEQTDAESAQQMQVLATIAPLDQQETEDEDSTSDPGPSNVGSPLDRDREVDESLAKVKKLGKEWEERVACAQEEVDRIAREAIPPRKITFATPTEQQPLATPKDNMKKAAELLKKKDEEIDINYVRKLVASAMQQQSKADTSRRLESNPDHCISTAQKDAIASQHRDGESRTGSTERRRKEPERRGDHHQEEGSHRSRSQPREQRRNRRKNILQAPSQISLATTQWRRRWRRRRRPEIPLPLKVTRRRSRDARERLNEYRSDYIGPKCFGRMIREEPKPRSLNLKLPGNLKHYDGSERPDTWIEDYYNAVTFAGGTPNIACRMLQLYLIGPARVWLSDLEENTIFCWFDLKKAFENHFRGTYKRPATTSDLQPASRRRVKHPEASSPDGWQPETSVRT
ncbi:hypothetical protein QYE76_028515 [Lolium multiflorum]|uniref:Uncharacterized protein n=1 Tax=Lolium multiflorum TaxID=4521 RepID=A0AAD8QNU2_LOLMU|nr:hypothetical protein QYE76_028515 [Lolium multiflorum]